MRTVTPGHLRSTAAPRAPSNLPYFHVFGFMANLWLPLIEGMKLVLYANPLGGKRSADGAKVR